METVPRTYDSNDDAGGTLRIEQLSLEVGAPALHQEHPAQFSDEILPVFARVIECWQLPVHDPFAGPGEKLGKQCDQLGVAFTGTELTPTWVEGAVNQRPGDPRVRIGDSTDAATYPDGAYCVVTSPTYPNGVADDFKATDYEGRNTYRHSVQRANNGVDVGLEERNTGRYGLRRGEKSLATYWRLERAAVRHWPDHVLVNVKDIPYTKHGQELIYRTVDKWVALLEEVGYEIVDRTDVATPGQRQGANLHARPVETEAVLVCERTFGDAAT
jgi:hypothetical protein